MSTGKNSQAATTATIADAQFQIKHKHNVFPSFNTMLEQEMIFNEIINWPVNEHTCHLKIKGKGTTAKLSPNHQRNTFNRN